MKKLTALYFIVPIIGVIIFSFFYKNVKNELEQRAVEREKAQVQAAAARAERDVEMRKEAYRIARVDVERRLKEIEERKAEEKRQAAEVQAAKDARDLAYRERERQLKRFTDLQESRGVANEQLARVQEQLELQNVQVEYYQTASREVVHNKMTYEQALAKMDAAEQAAITHAAARAVAAKKG